MRKSLLSALIGAALASCSTGPVELSFIRIEGRVYDADSGIGLEGVQVALLYSAGAFGRGSSDQVSSDEAGYYVLAVEFDPPALCGDGTFEVGFVIPDGYQPDLGEFEPLDCVETAQYRDFKMWPDPGPG